MRSRPAGLVGALIYLAAGLAWIGLARPGGWPYLLAWFAAVAAVGIFLPGPANQVTLARAYLAAPALLYATSGSLGGLAACVAVAGATDLADGAVARRFRSVSQIGGALDPVVDGLFFAAAAGGLAWLGAYPPWIAVVVAVRYGLPALAAGMLVLAGRRFRFEHTPAGQVCTTLVALLLGGFALFRAAGWGTAPLVLAAALLLPPATVATWVNLAWRARSTRTPAGRTG